MRPIFRCRRCSFRWERTDPPEGAWFFNHCPKCDHDYSDWLNFEEFADIGRLWLVNRPLETDIAQALQEDFLELFEEADTKAARKRTLDELTAQAQELKMGYEEEV